MNRAIVVGASLAGVFAAQSLRRAGYRGELVIVGDEPHRPYDRPPLSKTYLTGDAPDESRLTLRPVAEPDALDLTWELGRRAVGLDAAASELALDDGRTLGYDGLVIATGARPRRLPGTDRPAGSSAGLHVLRGLDDARALRAALDAGPDRIAVCGAGFIGSEVASSARERGLEVTLIDASDAPLDRVLDTEAGMAVADLHRRNGVDVRLGVGVTSFPGADRGRVGGVALADGTTVDASVVVIGIGVTPNVEWLDGSGFEIADGLVTDDRCTVDSPGAPVVAAGDVARWPNRRFDGRSMRVEQWDNAVEMGLFAGRRLAALMDVRAGNGSPRDRDDESEPFAPVPWFWSDQYDRKIHLAGIAEGVPEPVQGSVDEPRLVRLYVAEGGRVNGALCWNRPRQAIMARQLIAAGVSVTEAREKLGG